MEILNEIKRLPKPILIGISGFGGSGKSTFAKEVAKELDAPVIGVDDFWKSTDNSGYDLWENIDYDRLCAEVINPFQMGSNEIVYGTLNWEENRIIGNCKVKCSDILIVEGVGLFRPSLMDRFSYTIWIDCPIDVAIARGKRRDNEDYGVNNDEYWDGIWRKNDLGCYNEFKPREKVDLVIEYRK